VTTQTSDDWDLLEIPMFDMSFLLNLVLWHGDDVIVSSPLELRTAVIDSLTKLVAIHG